MKCQVIPIDLKLRRDFIVAGGRENLKRNFVFIIEETGLGEAAGSVHYGASVDEIGNDLNAAIRQLSEYATEDFPDAVKSIGRGLCPPARCAISTAWHDWKARMKKKSLYKHLTLGKPPSRPTSVTVSVGDAESLAEHMNAGYKYIKIKMDGDYEMNRRLVAALNNSREICFRVDANGSWTAEEAREVISLLNPEKVEMIEQPFPADAVREWKKLHEYSPIPLFMDESIVDADDVKRVAGYVDGVNIKIQKSGYLETAVEALETARKAGLKTMLGCMIESSVGIAAAWHLSSLADYLDLDGRLLIEDDPFTGLTYDKDILEISDTFGHGVCLVR